jgi:UDP-N-acetylglucosamine--dolichyl-phosphate N-acetylglucosaminephosphotransferase
MYNTYLTIIIPAIIDFAITIISVRFLKYYLYASGVIAEDRNKEKPIRLPSSGGLAVAFGIMVGILVYIFAGEFIFPLTGASTVLSISNLLAVALSIILISLVGFLDDINVKATRVQSTDMKDIRQGLKQWQKPLLTFIGALPLMAVNAGVSTVFIPFFGPLALGYLYPLVVLPLAIIFVANAFNLLGGFDGLQPSMALVASAGMFIYAVFYGTYTGAFLSAVLFFAVLAFLPFNWYKAKIIPGDSFTYVIGGTLVAIMAMGNEETFGVIIFIPWIIEFLLHARRRFKVTDLGIRQKDGTMKAPYNGKIYSLTHLVMNSMKATEVDVTVYLTLLEVFFVVLALGLKFTGLLH